MPILAPGRLVAAATAAVLCCAPVASPALGASHHSKKGLTSAVARATALKSATPLILDPADRVRVTGCTKSGSSYTCGLELQAANSASVCHWTVVVKKVRGVIDVVKYSHIDCAG